MPSPDVLESRHARRTVLGGLGAVALGALGGCLTRFGRRLPVSETSESVRGVPRQTDLTGDGNPFTVLAVGDRRFVTPPKEQPHCLWVWNDAATERTLTVQLSLAGRRTVFTRDVAFPADGILAVDLLEPADYRLALGGDADGYTFHLDTSWFDCNYSATDIAVRADGSVEESSITTTMGCGPL